MNLPNRIAVGPFCDIGLNLCDGMFKGEYNGKKRHEDDSIAVLERARGMGVQKCILTAGTVEDSRITMDLVQSLRSPEKGAFDVVSTVGVHPTRCDEFKILGDDAVIEALSGMIEKGVESRTVVAIGEAGLDYDRLHFCEKEVQMHGFIKQIELANLYGLPMFLHNRNTGGDFVDVVRQHRSQIRCGGVVHSFDGGLDEMNQLVDMGFYIGINGCSLRTKENMDVAAQVPESHLLMETDAPYCGVKNSHAGSGLLQTKFVTKKKEKWEEGCMIKDRNEPCTMTHILEILSSVRGVNADELAQRVYQNSCDLFWGSH